MSNIDTTLPPWQGGPTVPMPLPRPVESDLYAMAVEQEFWDDRRKLDRLVTAATTMLDLSRDFSDRVLDAAIDAAETSIALIPPDATDSEERERLLGDARLFLLKWLRKRADTDMGF